MKYILILGDGMADIPIEKLNNKTPLEVADKPNIDGCAKVSYMGMCKTVPDGMKPGSDVANLSAMGYDPLKYYTGRSPLEALSIGIDLKDTDVAFRANLVTLSESEDFENKTMIDYSAGEISSEESKILIDYLNENLKLENSQLYNGISYRHCFVLNNTKTGAILTPPHDITLKSVNGNLPKGDNASLLMDIMKKSYDLLSKHPLNIEKVKNGKNPANCLWFWGEGVKPQLDSFKDLYKLNGAVISAVDLLKGIGIASGLKVYNVEGATGTIHTNFEGKVDALFDALENNNDFVYIHLEAPDECSHQGDMEGKIKSIEYLDNRVFRPIKDYLDKKGESYRILVMPDHPTPLSTRTHSSDAVPFMIYDSEKQYSGKVQYSEKQAKETNIYYDSGCKLLTAFLEK